MPRRIIMHNGRVYRQDRPGVDSWTDMGPVDQPSASSNLPETLPFLGMDTGIPIGKQDAATLVGAGSTFTKLGRGVQAAIQGQTPEMQQAAQSEEPGMAALRSEMPISTGFGELTPYLMGGAAAAPLLPEAGIPAFLSQAGLGAAEGGLTYSPDQSGRINVPGAEWGAAGGGLGYLGGRLVGRVVGGIRDMFRKAPMSQLERQLIDQAPSRGFRPTPAAQRGSRVQGIMETRWARTPGLGQQFQEIADQNNAALVKGAARALGSQADYLSDPELQAAKQTIGKMFEAAKKGKTATMPRNWLEDLTRRSTPDGADQIERLLKNQDWLKEGKLNADSYVQLRSRIGRQMRSLFRRGEGEAAKDLSTMIDELDQAFENANPDMADGMRKARTLWRNYTAIKSAADPVSGELMPGKLWQTMKRMGYRPGVGNDFADTVATAATLADRQPMTGFAPGAANGLHPMNWMRQSGISAYLDQNPLGKVYAGAVLGGEPPAWSGAAGGTMGIPMGIGLSQYLQGQGQ